MSQQPIVILGMHRSGTSALAGALICLGGSPPKTLMPLADQNPRGFWESMPICRFHDHLLQSLGTRWDDWGHVALETVDESRSAHFREEVNDLLRDEFGDAPVAVIKDPRMCRLVPVWRQVLEASGVPMRAAIALRNPVAVARSLAIRDGIREAHATLLWLRHVLEAEYETRTVTRSFVWFDDLLSDPEGTLARLNQELSIAYPTSADNRHERLRAFLSSGLRHHRSDERAESLPPLLESLTRAALAALSDLVRPQQRDPSASQLVLDDLRGTVDDMARSLRGGRLTLSAPDSLGKARDPLGETLNRAVEELEARHAILDLEREYLTRTLSAISADRDQARRRIETLEAQVERLDHAFATSRSELETARRHIEAIENSRLWRWTSTFRRQRATRQRTGPTSDE